tara:strand:- start:4898 stop:5884 length:987 start_codon:yes stop_codon:yes gene_type:complete
METYITEIKDTKFWKDLHGENADLVISFTMKKEFRQTEELFDNMLAYLSKNYNIPQEYLSAKLLTSVLMIAKFPDTFLDSEREILEQTVFERALEIYELINEGSKEYKTLGKKLFSFKIVFEDWKEKDLKQQLDLLCEMYYRYQESINQFANDVAKSEYVDELKQISHKIVNNMKRLTPNYQHYLDNYSDKIVSYSDKINNLVYKKLKDIYWENIEDEVFNNDNYEVIDRIIDDYQEQLESLKNDNFNGSKFNQYRGIYTPENFKNIATLLVRYNKQLDSENYDEIYDYTIEKINENPRNIVSIIKICFDRLEMIIKIKNHVDERNTD